MKDLMIDLETLGTNSDAPIISIGACFFDINSGEIGEKFDIDIEWSSAMAFGTPSAQTIQWWMQQETEARLKAISGKIDLPSAIEYFTKFFEENGDKNTIVWGNGSTFDIVILENAYRAVGYEPPWKFWNVNDVRTIRRFSHIDMKKKSFPGIEHVALHDAIHQAEYVAYALQQGLKVQPE